MQKHKYRVVWISSKRFGGGNLCLYWDLTWGKHSFNYLGIDFDVDLSKMIKINFEKKIIEIKSLLKQWSKRQLTPIGRITVIKTCLLPYQTLVIRFLNNLMTCFFSLYGKAL
jgi:hypothetical protein